MDKKDLIFEQQLIDSIADTNPPEDEILNINPWKIPIDLITWGLILTTLKLNFIHLQYILPTIGVVLIYLGFRSLRNENKYFKVLYILSIINLIRNLADILKVSTPLNALDYPLWPVGVAWIVFDIIILLIFHKALGEVYKKAGKAMESYGLIWTAIWLVLVFIIAISPMAASWLFFIPLILLYILIIKSVFSIGEELDDTGYMLTNASVKINNKTFRWTYILIVMAIGIGFNLYYNHLKLESREFIIPGYTLLRENLLEMGFPDEALKYLKDSDVELLQEAVNIQTDKELLMFDLRETEHIEETDNNKMINYTYEPGRKNLESNTIFIEMPGNTLYVMQYFKWNGGKPVWQEAIMMSGTDKAENKKIISSNLFYNKKGKGYTAEFPGIAMREVIVNSMFGSHTAEPILASFSFPFGSRGQGGYILYSYGEMEDDRYLVPSVFDYFHSNNSIRIPYVKTVELLLNGNLIFNNNYKQHYTTYESVKSRQIEE